MSFEVDSKTFKWLVNYKLITPSDVKQLSSSTFEIKDPISNQFQNGTKISLIVVQIYKKIGLPIPATLNHLKQTNGTAAQLYNWNILNDALKKVNFQIDSQTKNLIINGDRLHLAMIIRKLIAVFQNSSMEDSLAGYEKNNGQSKKQQMKQSLTLSRSQQPAKSTSLQSQNLAKNLQQNRKPETRQYMAKGDLIQFVVNQLMQNLKLSRKQAIALLADNNKYLAHVLVKGVKGQFTDIQYMLQKFFSQIDYIIEKMTQQNDMCFYFLQIIKPCLLSKSQEIAQWGCRILTKIAHELAIKQLLPLAYDWFVQESGGLSTTILALSRHPKLNQNVVGYILQFSRYNVTQLFTIQLRKITNNDNLIYVKFMLLIFNPLTQSKISSEQLLQSGAIDYWIQITLKGAENDPRNSKQLRMYCIQFLIKIWRAYPAHIQQTLDQVNNIMNQIKRGIRDQSQTMRFSLMELMFDLLDEFANKKNPYASIVYKKLTFLFIQNHEQLTMREFILRNLQVIFQKYQSIPVQIFLEPFIKQIKISQSKSYLVNIFDMQFINIAVKHKKLKVGIGLQLFDLLAKTKLNSYSFSVFATDAMEVLIGRFLSQEIFLQYTVKLVKISLAMFYSTLKHKKPYQDQQRLQAQKRAEIVNMIISLIQRSNQQLNSQIKSLVVHVKVQIYNKLGTQHKGIQRILGYFKDVDQAILQAMQSARDQLNSNATSTAKEEKGGFHLPPIQNRNKHLRDDTQSQQSLRSRNTKYSLSSKQQFPQKDYSRFAEQDQKKFLKQNGLGLKKKPTNQKKSHSTQKQSVDPKVQEQLLKIKQKKQDDQKKKLKEREQTQKKKQILKQKIQKQLQQRNVKQGLKGLQKDVEAKVIFEENQLNDNILQDDQNKRERIIDEQQQRDKQSISIVLKRYAPFIKKLYNRYANLKGAKKQIQDMQNPQMAQVDLLRLCKQKNIEKSKNTIVEILKEVNNKNVNSLTIDVFFKFLESLCIQVYIKQKCSTKVLMGDLMKKILRRMSEGQNFKLDEDDDQACRQLSQKIRYNPHIDLPQNFKKIYEKVYKINQNFSYPVKKALKSQAIITCYQIVNQLLKNTFKFNIIQQQVRFLQEGRVVHKKQAYLPPKPIIKKQKQQVTLPLLSQKQTANQLNKKKPIVRSASKAAQDIDKQRQRNMANSQSKSRSKIINVAEKKKMEEQQQNRKKKQIQQQMRKQRALQVKRKLQKQQQQRQKQKERKAQQKKQQADRQEEQQRKQKQKKQKYQKQQKQKLQKFKKQQEEKQRQQKSKQQEQKKKDQQQRKQKLKEQMKKQQQKRKQQFEKSKKQKQLSEQETRKKKQEEERKKQQLKKQMMKKMGQQKQKLQINKISKQVMNKIYNQPQIQQIVNSKFKDQLKAIFNFGKEYNEFKLQKGNINVIQQKGWLNLCQQLNFCDSNTANKIIKTHIKQKNSSGISQQGMQQIIFQLSCKKQIQSDLQDYDKAKKACSQRFQQFLGGLKLPKGNQKLKQYFIGLKNQVIKKSKEQLTVTNPNGEKQTWEVNQ